MKQDIHPKYYPKAKVTCACGNTFTVGSTQEAINVEICSACHPFYTGKQKLIDTARRVDKFQKRIAAQAQKAAAAKGKKAKKEKQKKLQAAKKAKVKKEK
ncbi:MAG TPA: 50S ribosomal protein L31 [bacterium]|nr:50S ribosomal protein L31 [bacterium]HNZ73460.1 50S ribosomal protein L31 [bacterium]HOH67405.1 50S ribosomal protein L31 [bacterium]HPN81099.1 50S ribosomal protein L31 [bacterium]HPW39157.1 50S ribosomal protein L31 [bacterium]